MHAQDSSLLFLSADFLALIHESLMRVEFCGSRAMCGKRKSDEALRSDGSHPRLHSLSSLVQLNPSTSRSYLARQAHA